jgi:hypothetical protein
LRPFCNAYLIALFAAQCLFADHAVTYSFSGGRFGDNLLSYLHAKWMAFHHGILLAYIPFKYSQDLLLSEKEIHREQFDAKHIVSMKYFSQWKHSWEPTLFICPYFEEFEEMGALRRPFQFQVDWKNKEFRQACRKMISPKNPLALIDPPYDLVGVAMHVREGGGFDDPRDTIWNPLKFPPIDFYADSLIKVWKLLIGKKIYCHLFTDANEPKILLDRIQKLLPPECDVLFKCREIDNRHNAHVLEDFFSLFNFDILIRPHSNFSIVPSLIQDYAIVCSPNVGMEKVKVTICAELFEKCLNK